MPRFWSKLSQSSTALGHRNLNDSDADDIAASLSEGPSELLNGKYFPNEIGLKLIKPKKDYEIYWNVALSMPPFNPWAK